jgi:hypothetical protein
MRQLFINIGTSYVIIIICISVYLYFVKLNVNEIYDIVILTNPKDLANNKRLIKQKDIVFLSIENVQLEHKDASFRIKYYALVKNLKKEFFTGKIKQIENHKGQNLYKAVFNSPINLEGILDQNTLGAFLIVSEKKPLYAILFQKIINPFLK